MHPERIVASPPGRTDWEVVPHRDHTNRPRRHWLRLTSLTVPRWPRRTATSRNITPKPCSHSMDGDRSNTQTCGRCPGYNAGGSAQRVIAPHRWRGWIAARSSSASSSAGPRPFLVLDLGLRSVSLMSLSSELDKNRCRCYKKCARR